MHPKAMKSSSSLRVRKGAWGSDEDSLLRKCINKYGEGRWNLVPHRAGLNRCRKSCRLRWLNYLRPSIKRGDFGEDEVDLMMRLYKLLGNRWSLIAGRLPGRTANDVKNFWNTNLQKKLTIASNQKEAAKKEELTHVVIKPLPHTISKGTKFPCYIDTDSPSFGMTVFTNNMFTNKPATPTPDQDEWWKNFFTEIGNQGQEEDPSGLSLGFPIGLENLDAETGLISTKDEISPPAPEATTLLLEHGWSDIWDLLNSD